MYPRRIVCLTEETTETLYLLGEQHRIVGISGFTVRPPQARREKPKVSAFTSANIRRILELEPDLVLGFSDLQADIAAELIRAGVAVHVFNQRTVQGILDMVVTLGSLVGARERAERLAAELRAGLARIEHEASRLPRRPRVYFEEWDDPLISGIGWVGELVELAGGRECFPELRGEGLARDRIVDPDEVVRRRPEIIVASWCGKRFRPERVRARPGWDLVPAVRDGELHELPASEILSPGPAALTDGVQGLHRIVRAWAERHG
jgi:iron complex transport system substrate-binding protein